MNNTMENKAASGMEEVKEPTGFQKFVDNMKDPVKRKVRNKKILVFLGVLLRTFVLIGLCFVILLPVFEKLSAALRHPTDISNSQVVWIPAQFSIINFRVAAKLLNYNLSLWNTLKLSFFCMVIQIIATAIAGYSFARLKFKGSGIVFILVIFTLVVPNEALDRSRTWIMNEHTFLGISLIGNAFSMYVMCAFGQGIRSAIFIFLFRQFFKGIPIELEESAQVDGAGVIRTFVSVMLPNARGAIVTVGLFAFVWQWNDCYFGQLLGYTTQSGSLLAVKLATGTEQLRTVIETWRMAGDEVLSSFVASGVVVDPVFIALIANTAALLIMLPLLIGYFFVQKLFVESIERTGIVG